MRRPGELAQNTLTLQGKDHQVTTASWALCPPLPRSHIWCNGRGGRGALVPRTEEGIRGRALGGGWGRLVWKSLSSGLELWRSPEMGEVRSESFEGQMG